MSAQWRSVIRHYSVRNSISSLALMICLAGCGGGDASSSQGQIARYVSSQHLQQVQRTRITELSTGQIAEIFLVEYGPGNDCPSGCIYSRLFGLRDGSKIGRLAYAQDSVSDRYNFDASDAALYTEVAFDKIKAIDPNGAYFWFLDAISADPDVPVDVLVRVAHRVEVTSTGNALLSNPTATASRDVLTVLANLTDPNPAAPSFNDIRSRAQQLLNALNTQ